MVRKVERFYLPRRGRRFCLDVQFTYSVSYTLRYKFAYVLRTRYLMETKVICMIARAGEGLATRVSVALCSRRQKAWPTLVRKACQDQWRGGRGAEGAAAPPLS